MLQHAWEEDIWALGASLYFILTGSFLVNSPSELSVVLRTGTLPKVESMCHPLKNLLRTILRINRKDRPTADELADLLRNPPMTAPRKVGYSPWTPSSCLVAVPQGFSMAQYKLPIKATDSGLVATWTNPWTKMTFKLRVFPSTWGPYILIDGVACRVISVK